MTYALRGHPAHRRIAAVAFFALALVALIAPAAGSAAKKKDPDITVMSRNIYLGADLGPAIDAGSLPEAVDAAGEIFNQVVRTNFPARAKLLAKEIKRAKPDLLGLQEVALWRVQTPADYTASPATEVRYDFLKTLREELRERGTPYRLVVKQNEFDEELPADTDGSDATGTFFGADLDGRLTMRDVILKRAGTKVKTGETDKAQFENRYEAVVGGIPIPVERGWVSVEAKVEATERTKKRRFRFVNTHLEAFGDPEIREAQARELFAQGGPLRGTGKQLVFLGDINSGNQQDRVGAPFSNPEDPLAYNALTQDFGLIRVGKRQTCCYPSPDLSSEEIGGYRFDHTVDHVMVLPRIRQLGGYVTGDDPTVTTPQGLVSSDHGGVVSKLRLSKER